jgi:hypothetical protein
MHNSWMPGCLHWSSVPGRPGPGALWPSTSALDPLWQIDQTKTQFPAPDRASKVWGQHNQASATNTKIAIVSDEGWLAQPIVASKALVASSTENGNKDLAHDRKRFPPGRPPPPSEITPSTRTLQHLTICRRPPYPRLKWSAVVAPLRCYCLSGVVDVAPRDPFGNGSLRPAETIFLMDFKPVKGSVFGDVEQSMSPMGSSGSRWGS